MQDFIPIGTGNSRYLKSVENFKTLYPTYDAFAAALVAGTLPVDFNGINEAGVVQKGMALNKYNLLKDATAALFGLDGSAVPDDVFGFLGKYNQHWWKRRTWQDNGEYKASLVTKSLSSSRFYITDQNDYPLNRTITFSANYTLNPANGEITLTNPSTITAGDTDGYISNTNKNKLLGCYCKNCYSAPDDIVYIASDATIDVATNSSNDYGYYINDSTYEALQSSYVANITTGEWEFLHASDRDAYPDSGVSAGYEYEYIGIPFDELPGLPRIEVGTYIGTGTSQASLTFSFSPKLVVVMQTNVTSDGSKGAGIAAIKGMGTFAGFNTFYQTSGSISSWYPNDLDWSEQNTFKFTAGLNTSGTSYSYMAIG